MTFQSDAEHEREPLRCLVVGDHEGKSAFINAFIENKLMGSLPSDIFQPLVFETYSNTLKIYNEVIHVDIWDTANGEMFEDLRKSLLTITDVVILAFAVNGSVENVDMYVNESKSVFPGGQGPPIILVGTRIDLRGEEEISNDTGEPLTTYAEGVKLAKKIGARRYVVCSAKKDLQSVHNLFEVAVKEALRKKPIQSSSAAFSFSCFRQESTQQDDQR